MYRERRKNQLIRVHTISGAVRQTENSTSQQVVVTRRKSKVEIKMTFERRSTINNVQLKMTRTRKNGITLDFHKRH